MKDLIVKRNAVSTCSTHHLDEMGKPLYAQRFDQVLPYHEPGLAPVSTAGQSWHIRKDGSDAYAYRFDRTFGFYCGLSTVAVDEHWFHINPSGEAVYPQRYMFAGNYQSDMCVVCGDDFLYFHIDTRGVPVYLNKWRYCGDFREGYAVVQREDGLSTHININGQFIHDQWFIDLDVYHKGYARACDILGWYHISVSGEAIYSERYASIEPFYNGFSRVETRDGALLIIDEKGQARRILRDSTLDYFAELSADMVGYWHTFTISAAVELGIFNCLPGKTENIAKKINASCSRLDRLMNALGELGVVKSKNTEWYVTEKGCFLKTDHFKSLSSAAIEYSHDLLERWRDLPNVIGGKEMKQDLFASVANDTDRCQQHHKMLSSYALHDYQAVLSFIDINPGEIVFDAAGGSGMLSRLLARTFPQAKIICGDMQGVSGNQRPMGFENVIFDLFQPWPVKAHKVILARVLHDWNDQQALSIIRFAKECLLSNGQLIVIEMLLPESGFSGSLCDLHLMMVTGGQERHLSEYASLLLQEGFEIESVNTGSGLVSVLRTTSIDG